MLFLDLLCFSSFCLFFFLTILPWFLLLSQAHQLFFFVTPPWTPLLFLDFFSFLNPPSTHIQHTPSPIPSFFSIFSLFFSFIYLFIFSFSPPKPTTPLHLLVNYRPVVGATCPLHTSTATLLFFEIA